MAKQNAPALAQKLFEAHLNQLKNLVEKRGARGLRALYEEGRADLYDRLRKAGRKSERATPTTLRAMIGQAEGALSLMGDKLRDHLEDVGHAAAELGARHAVDEYKRLETIFEGTTPVLDLERASVFRGLVEGVDSSLLRRYRLLSGTWSLSATANMERSLSVGALTGKPIESMIDDVMQAGGVVDGERYKAERIVRSEMSYGAGSAKFAAMRATAEELGDEKTLHKRIVETFDDRTGDDSFTLHGQTVPMDEMFAWKHKVGGKWVVTEYAFPPSRPNDRAVMIPWDPTWEETEEERPLSKAELRDAMPTRWRKTVGVPIPPGYRPGKPQR